MTSGDNFAALRAAVARLANPAKPLELAALVEIDQSSRPHANALIDQYVHTPESNAEFEEQLWQTLEAYLQQLDDAYTSVLQGKTLQQDSELLGKAFAHRLNNLMLLALCHYLRYQPLPGNFWLKLNAAYQMAEKAMDATGTTSSGCVASYVQTLMLGTVNCTNMLKWEIALVNKWLEGWCQDLSLAKEYDEEQHLFFVDLLENNGARRMRDFTPKPSHRYWHVDNMTSALERMQQLEGDILPPDFEGYNVIPNVMRHIEHLLAEWSRTDYRRQRRVEDRDGVSKSAQVVHGIFNVCQRVKNSAFASLSPAPVYNEDGVDSTAGKSEENSWIIENESKFGFGAAVKADLNSWLKPGRLIALDYELNPNLTVVGVVRSIQQQSENICYAGIEVLSHTPSYVRLQHMDDSEMDLATDGAEPFPALYLAKDDERDQLAALVMPSFQFVESGVYRLRTQQQAYRVKLGDVVEQQYDWIRAQINMMDKGA